MKIYFNNNKQWLKIVFGDPLHRFKKKEKCYAYYIAAEDRLQRNGLFGYIYLPTDVNSSPMWHELIAHEIQHAIIDWILCRKGMTLNEKNEERISTMTGEIHRRFWRKWEKKNGS